MYSQKTMNYCDFMAFFVGPIIGIEMSGIEL